MPVLGIYHLNVNVSNLERSRAFYERLGFRVVETFHEDGNPDLDRGLGLERSHTDALFLRLGDDPRSTLIDLVQWTEPAAVGGTPEMNRLGPVRIALRVKELDRMV
ncbi:MAG: VOC family protein, partial [Candidatus Binatia bacterium]